MGPWVILVFLQIQGPAPLPVAFERIKYVSGLLGDPKIIWSDLLNLWMRSWVGVSQLASAEFTYPFPPTSLRATLSRTGAGRVLTRMDLYSCQRQGAPSQPLHGCRFQQVKRISTRGLLIRETAKHRYYTAFASQGRCEALFGVCKPAATIHHWVSSFSVNPRRSEKGRTYRGVGHGLP